MKLAFLLIIALFFVVFSGFQGLIWLLKGIMSSFDEMMAKKDDKDSKQLRMFSGRVLILFFTIFGAYQAFWVELPKVVSKILH